LLVLFIFEGVEVRWCKHGFPLYVFGCYGDEPQMVLYELHKFGTCWGKVRNMVVRRLMRL